MDEKEENYSPQNFPYTLPEKYGEIKAAFVECPGVYYVSALPEDALMELPNEYYVVEQNTRTISDVAKAYGTRLEKPAVYLFSLDDPDSGCYVVEYEISRYKVKHHEPVEEDKTPLLIARYAVEYQPEYFGEIPVPLHTPWGQITRYRQLMRGVFVFETEKIIGGLAVWYPIWEGDLSDSTNKQAHFTSAEGPRNFIRTMPFAFYTIPESCLPIFELWGTTEKIRIHVDYPRLMNAIWKHYPEYAMAWNAREQVGANDIHALFLNRVGFDVDVRHGPEHAISITQGVDDHYLVF